MKIGARRDTSSGEHSGIMIASLTKTADHNFASYHSVALNDIDYFLQHILKLHGNSDSVLMMPGFIKKQRDKSAQLTHSSSLVNSLHDLRIEQFNAQKRSFSNTAASIYARLQNTHNEASKHLQALFERAHHKNLSKEEKQKVLFELRHNLQNK
jgi:tRNA(Met) cytidine acetyltransferase